MLEFQHLLVNVVIYQVPTFTTTHIPYIHSLYLPLTFILPQKLFVSLTTHNHYKCFHEFPIRSIHFLQIHSKKLFLPIYKATSQSFYAYPKMRLTYSMFKPSPFTLSLSSPHLYTPPKQRRIKSIHNTLQCIWLAFAVPYWLQRQGAGGKTLTL